LPFWILFEQSLLALAQSGHADVVALVA